MQTCVGWLSPGRGYIWWLDQPLSKPYLPFIICFTLRNTTIFCNDKMKPNQQCFPASWIWLWSLMCPVRCSWQSWRHLCCRYKLQWAEAQVPISPRLRGSLSTVPTKEGSQANPKHHCQILHGKNSKERYLPQPCLSPTVPLVCGARGRWHSGRD